MQQMLGYGALKAGISYLPLAGSIVVSAGVASQLVTKVGFKPVLLAGLVLIAIGLVWFGQISADGSFASDILGPSLVAAVGLGFAFVPVTIAAVAGVKDRDQGLAGGLINTSQQVGGALGLAVLATIANSRTASLLSDAHGAPGAVKGALTSGFQSRRIRDSRPGVRVPADPSRGLPSSRRGGDRRERGLNGPRSRPGYREDQTVSTPLKPRAPAVVWLRSHSRPPT
jgi:hypothetical protein